MDVDNPPGTSVSGIAAAIGEPARERMLFCLMDNRARTSTELAVVADVSPSTASVHLSRLKTERLVKVLIQGKHRYYSLAGAHVAKILEGLSVLAGYSRNKFEPSTPNRLRAARTCYDHLAGSLGVLLHDRLVAMQWLSKRVRVKDNSYDLTAKGIVALEALGVGIAAARALRRRFAFACLDWSERRSHVGGALGAALLNLLLKRKWATQDLDSRALAITTLGRREMQSHFGVRV